MSHATRYITPVPETTAIRLGAVTKSYNTHYNPSANDYPWSGYAVSAQQNPGFTNLKWTFVQGEWTVPHGHTYCQSSTDASFDSPWVGLGGDGWDGGTGNLIQDGTITYNHNPAPASYFWWYNYYTGDGSGLQLAKNVPIAPGDDAYTSVTYNGNLTSTFFFENVSSGVYFSLPKATSHVDLTAADFINEDQPASWDFVNFGTVPFKSEFMSGSWGNGYSISKVLSDSINLSSFTSYKNGGDTPSHKVAWPTAVDGNGNFTDYATPNDGC
ncbi:MAG: G1 family glutamic endopeptidase [Chloroflexota bacterium]